MPDSTSYFIKLECNDGHAMYIHSKFCKHSDVLMNMANPPCLGEDDPTHVQAVDIKLFSSFPMGIVCRYLLYKSAHIDQGKVGHDFPVTVPEAMALVEAALFFKI